MSTTVLDRVVRTATDAPINQLHVEISQPDIDDLRQRIEATRWPSKELVNDRSQGVQLATMQEVARYWTIDYDPRRGDNRLNVFDQLKTAIGRLYIPFIHVRSPHANPLP